MFETSLSRIRPDKDFKDIQDRVLRKFPLLGATMSKLKFVASNSVGTAATDGNVVYYAPKFFDTLTDRQKDFVVAHEILHVAFNHMLRSKDKNPRLWNIATDAVINQILKNENLPMVEGGVDMAEAVNRSAEEMYEKLLKKREEKRKQREQEKQGKKGDKSEDSGQDKQQNNQDGQSGQEQPQDDQNGGEQNKQEDQKSGQNEQQNGKDKQDEQNQNGQNGGAGDDLGDGFDIDLEDDENEQVGHDNHDLWKKAVEKAEKEKAKQQETPPNGQKTPDASDRSNGDTYDDKKPDEQDTDKGSDKKHAENNTKDSEQEDSQATDFEKTFADMNRSKRAETARRIRDMLEQKKNEHLASLNAQSYGDVGESQSVLDWKKVLKKTLEDEEDRWSYRRSSADNDFMARVETLEDEQRAQTQVLLDTSGSVNEDMLKEFLRQLKPLLKTSKLSVGCFDHRFYGFTEIKTKADIDAYHIRGGGGTDLDLAVKSFGKDKDINKIVFTDGGIGGCNLPSDETKNIKVLWLVYDNPTYNPVCGKVITVDTKPLTRYRTASPLPLSRGR